MFALLLGHSVFSCLSFLFTSDQIDTQFAVYLFTGLMAMVINAFLVVSYLYTSQKSKKKDNRLPTFVGSCALLGVIFASVDTLPTAALKLELSCRDGCTDEFCHGDSFLCKLQQPSEYLLLGVFCILLQTLLKLYMKAVLGYSTSKEEKLVKVYTFLAFAMVLFCIVVCFLADTVLQSGSTDYRHLIVARDSFNCTPRYSSPVQEFAFLTLPFMLVCLALVCVTATVTGNVVRLTLKTANSSFRESMGKIGKTAGRLLLLSFLVSILWLIRVIVAGLQKPIVDAFNEDARRWADCMSSASFAASWMSIGGTTNECNAVPNTGNDMFTAVTLMAAVKNMEACVVGFIWGASSFIAISRPFISSTITKLSGGGSMKIGPTSDVKYSYNNVSEVKSSAKRASAVSESSSIRTSE